MVQIKSTESLNNKKIDELFIFLLDKTNFKNKVDVNTLFWDIIYLRKLLNKSIKSKRSTKRNLRYNYVLLDDKDNIIACISYKYLLATETENLELWDLTIIIKPELYDDTINTALIKHFREHDALENAVLAVYMPVGNHKVSALFNKDNCDCDYESSRDGNGMCKFVFGLEDNITYQEKYNIYYNFQLSRPLKSITGVIQSKPAISITTGGIISLLLNGYNLDTVIQRRTGTIQRSRMTKKQIPIPDIKIITRNIYDIPEIQNLPEYDYDFFKMYSLKYLFIFEYLINKNMSVHDFVMKRFFGGSLTYNKNLYNLYLKIVNTAVENINLDNLKDKILNINYIIKNNQYFIYEIENALVNNLIGKYKNRLIISNNYDKLKYFSIYKNDIISIKQFTDKIKENTAIQKLSSKIIISNKYQEYQNVINNINKKYDCIFIEVMYANFDYILGNMNLICKMQTIIFYVLNALLKLNKNGCFIINLREGYIDTPIFKKLLTILCGLFNTNDFIGLYSLNRIFIKFDNFKGLDYKNEKLIETLINQSKEHEKNEINQNDMIGLLLSNKFNYQITNIDIKKIHFNSNVLFDIEGLSINTKLIKNIMDKYNTYLEKQNFINNQLRNFYKSSDKDNTEIIKYQYIYLFENIKKYNIIDIKNIDRLIKIFKSM